MDLYTNMLMSADRTLCISGGMCLPLLTHMLLTRTRFFRLIFHRALFISFSLLHTLENGGSILMSNTVRFKYLT